MALVKHVPGSILILAAAVLWGTTGTTQELAPAAATPLTVGALRLLVAAAALLVIAAARGQLRDPARLRRPATLVAVLGVGLYQPFFFLAVDRTGVVIGTIVAIGSAPIVGGFLAWGYDRRPPPRLWAMATAVAIVGVALLVAAGRDADSSVDGIAFAVLAGTAYASYVIAARQFARAGDVLGSTAIIFALAAVLLSPLLATDSLAWVATVGGAVAILHLGILATAVAYLLFTTGLRTTKSTTATTLSLGEPLTAALLGVILVGERPPALAWFGFALVLGALVVVATEGWSSRLAPRRARG